MGAMTGLQLSCVRMVLSLEKESDLIVGTSLFLHSHRPVRTPAKTKAQKRIIHTS
jgi:hypothetical protein